MHDLCGASIVEAMMTLRLVGGQNRLVTEPTVFPDRIPARTFPPVRASVGPQFSMIRNFENLVVDHILTTLRITERVIRISRECFRQLCGGVRAKPRAQFVQCLFQLFPK